MLNENAPRIRTELQVMFFDTDCAAVVHNIAYLRFIEVARTLLAEELGLGLAAVLHLASAGWSDLYDGTEGQFAGGAREMLETHQWLVPTNNNVPQLQTPPVVYWLIVLSYKIFGVSVAAARAPIAIAMIT